MKITRRAQSLPEFEAAQKEALKLALTAAAGSVAQTARETGFARSHVNRLLDKYELRAFAAELRIEAGARQQRAGERVGVVGLGRPARKMSR